MPWFFWPRVTTSNAFRPAWTTESHPVVSVTFFVDMLKNTAQSNGGGGTHHGGHCGAAFASIW